MKKLIILLTVFCFWAGCTQVKNVITDVKDGVQGVFKKDKGETQKPPAEQKDPGPVKEPEPADKGATEGKGEPASPTKPKKKETRNTPPASKKENTKTISTPSGEVFGPK